MQINLLDLYNKVLKQNWVTAGKDVQYVLVNNTLYLQCSVSLSDWKHNFMFKAQPYDNNFIAHKGFTLLWLSIKPIIEGLEFTSIVAYSQGGGIAHFIHENYYHRKGVEPKYTIAFGTPPSLYKYKGHEKFNNFYYIFNKCDIVYWFPQILGYKPTGRKIALRAKARKPDSIKGIKGFFYWYSGHSPEEYKQRLEGFNLEIA